MLADMAEAHWPLTGRGQLTPESDHEYYRRRSDEERSAARAANGSAARRAHQQLADLHRLVADASQRGATGLRFGSIERREAMLDDALDDSFPASDPPAIIAPAGPARWN
jgi:hypothetical protein